MANKAQAFWAKAKDPVLFTVLGALLILAMKNCGDGNRARETNDIVKEVAANVDTIKHDADTVKATVKAVHKIVTRTEKKVDCVQETADSILAKIDSCCGCICNKKPAPVVQLVKQPVKRPQNVTDTVTVVIKPVIVKPDTLPVKKPVCDTFVGIVVCREYCPVR